MPHGSYKESRRKTPWDNMERNATQEFLYSHYKDHYEQRHPTLLEAGEAEMINSYVPTRCPYCSAEHFVKRGRDNNGIQRFKCMDCGQKFKPTTGTIFDSRRIPISEWMEYCLNIFRYVSLNADSWNNKNTFATSKYWLEKLFLTLSTYQDDIVLDGNVWLDETYYSVLMRDRVTNEDGNLLRGLSKNQICIGAATNKSQSICIVEGTGKPSQAKSFEAFSTHIAPGATLIHDKETTHTKLVTSLDLVSQEYASKDLKGLSDKDNPMYPINRIHFLLKKFLNAHSGFKREELQGYLDLFTFVMNPPHDPLEKVELVVKLAFQNPKLLRYRDAFGVNIDS